jgi:hypothetical protein
MPTSTGVYSARDTFSSEILLAEQKERRYTSRERLNAVQDQVNVLFYATLVCGPGGLTRIDTRWIGFCPIRPYSSSHGPGKTFEVDHEANRWSCSACAVGGDALDLAKATARCDHDEAAGHVLMSAFHILRYAEGV